MGTKSNTNMYISDMSKHFQHSNNNKNAFNLAKYQLCGVVYTLIQNSFFSVPYGPAKIQLRYGSLMDFD